MADQVRRVRDALRRLRAVQRIYLDEAKRNRIDNCEGYDQRCTGTARGISMAVREVLRALKDCESEIARMGP